MAAIMTTHIPTNAAAAPNQDWPAAGIQNLESDHPPGIGIVEQHAGVSQRRIVPIAAAINSTAPAETNPRCRGGGGAIIAESLLIGCPS